MKEKQEIFSNNRKVSVRQMYRMMFLEIFGISSLLLPGKLAKVCQNDGFFAILAAAVLWAVLIRCVLKCRRSAENRTDIGKQETPIWLSKAECLLWLAVFCAAGGFLLFVLSSLAENQLLDTGYLWIVVLTVLFAGGYGIIRGMECRARIYEILFWFLVVPLLAAMVLGALEVKPDYWLPVFACGWPSFAAGVLLSMAAMSPAVLSIFFLPFCAQPGEAVGAAFRAVLLSGIFDAILYLLLLGVFQWKFLAQLKYPVISLMAVIQMPGDLFERQDALMTAIWFFCLFALFHSLCHYGAVNLQKLCSGKERQKADRDDREMAKEGEKADCRKKPVVAVMVLVLIAGLCFLLNGCGKKEPEESMYPLAIGVQSVKTVSEGEAKQNKTAGKTGVITGGESGCLDVFYAWPVPGGGGSSRTDAQAGDAFEQERTDSLFEAQMIVSQNTDKTLDFNHLKVLILDVDVLKDEEKMEQILYYFKENENMAWNTCVFAMEEDMGELFSGDVETEKSLGLYLEQMLQSRQDLKTDAAVTVKDLMSLYVNQTETVLIPQLSVAEGQPQISAYRIYARRTDHGSVSPEEASYGYLLLNLAKTVEFTLENGTHVTVQDLRLEREFPTDGKGERAAGEAPVQNIKVSGTVKLSASTALPEDTRQQILSEASETLQKELNSLEASVKKEHYADITGSFLVLPGYQRSIWKLYRDNPDAYEKKLKTDITVSLKMLNI